MEKNRETQVKTLDDIYENLRSVIKQLAQINAENANNYLTEMVTKLSFYGDFSYQHIYRILFGDVKKIPLIFVMAVSLAYGISMDELIFPEKKLTI